MSRGDFFAHLETGLTEVCRCWAITRTDGRVLGFTDHDQALEFDGIAFRPDSGLTAKAISQTTGLSVDNTEAMGALSDPAITEADIHAGRYDQANVVAWLVNWRRPDLRIVRFRGTIGEIRQGDGAFHAELRGLTEALNQPVGRTFQSQCGVVLGDKACGFDLGRSGYVAGWSVESVSESRVFRFSSAAEYESRWFERGRLLMKSGIAVGLSGLVRSDVLSDDGSRVLELWQSLDAPIVPGDLVEVVAGCDKRATTCQFKFDNLVNFRGFPHIPGEDWLVSVPVSAGQNDGGSLNR